MLHPTVKDAWERCCRKVMRKPYFLFQKNYIILIMRSNFEPTRPGNWWLPDEKGISRLFYWNRGCLKHLWLRIYHLPHEEYLGEVNRLPQPLPSHYSPSFPDSRSLPQSSDPFVSSTSRSYLGRCCSRTSFNNSTDVIEDDDDNDM